MIQKNILKIILKNRKGFQKQISPNFPYLLDESQMLQKFGAVCTPDFFGYNHHGKQYGKNY